MSRFTSITINGMAIRELTNIPVAMLLKGAYDALNKPMANQDYITNESRLEDNINLVWDVVKAKSRDVEIGFFLRGNDAQINAFVEYIRTHRLAIRFGISQGESRFAVVYTETSSFAHLDDTSVKFVAKFLQLPISYYNEIISQL